MTFVLVGGLTATARIDGLSAAGADVEAMRATPTADAEIVASGAVRRAPAVPVSPTGCPTPALVTRAVVERADLDVRIADAGLPIEPGVETTSVADAPGGDIREAEPLPGAAATVERAREVGRDIGGDDPLVIGESIPGGTTTALGIARALGVELSVSSSLPENPTERKHRVVETGLDASGLAPGDLADRPIEALRAMGDPVHATVAGLAQGALAADRPVTLAGGTQLLAVAALLRADGVTGDVEVATTSYVADDPSASARETADALDVSLTVTDPQLAAAGHAGLARFAAGEGKEGAGMGGALALARRQDIALDAVRERAAALYDHLIGREVA